MEIANLIGKNFGVVASKTTEDALEKGSPSDLHLCDNTGEIVFNNKRFGGAVKSVEVKAEGDNALAPLLVVEFCRRKVETSLPIASSTRAGLISAADKQKLDNLADVQPITEQQILNLFD